MQFRECARCGETFEIVPNKAHTVISIVEEHETKQYYLCDYCTWMFKMKIHSGILDDMEWFK